MSVDMTNMGAASILEAKANYIMPCVYHFYKDPPVIAAAKGNYLIDQNGRQYLDCYSGVTVMSAGHSNPSILSAAIEQLHKFQHTTTIYLSDPMVRLAERLAEITPGALKRSFFCASGSEANEAAMLLATLATGRQGFISLTDSLHGRTKWAMSATGLKMWRTDDSLLENIHFAHHAYCQRCPFNKQHPACEMACVNAIGDLIEEAGPDNIAALIAEPIQGNGGIIIPPEGYWQQVRELCDRYGILLIFDEIQTAINRTGKWFASEHWDAVPDIVTVAKALGNGFPIAAMITSDKLAGAYTRPGASTFGANPISCAAALATLEFHEICQLGKCAQERGQQLQQILSEISEKKSCLVNLRGKGLMIGVEVVDEQGNPDAARCDDYLESLKNRRCLAGKTGAERNVLTFMPPLTIDGSEISFLGEIVLASTTEVDNQHAKE